MYLTIYTEHHTNGGVSYGVASNAFIATFISCANITNGEKSLRANMKLSTLSYLYSILQESPKFAYSKHTCFHTRIFVIFFSSVSFFILYFYFVC